MLIALEDVQVAHGDRFALRIPSWAVRAGEKIALVGPSGSGKSTFLNLLAGRQPLRSGTAQVLETPLHSAAPPALRVLRARLGWVHQRPALLPYLDVLGNVLLPLRLAGRSIDDAQLIGAQNLLADLGLSGRIQHAPTALSEGEIQRAALARALLPRPALLLMDEPTAGLDTALRDIALRVAFEWLGARGTVIMATHDRRVVSQFDTVVDVSDWVGAEKTHDGEALI